MISMKYAEVKKKLKEVVKRKVKRARSEDK